MLIFNSVIAVASKVKTAFANARADSIQTATVAHLSRDVVLVAGTLLGRTGVQQRNAHRRICAKRVVS